MIMMPMVITSMTISVMFIFLKHPLSMGLMLILQTIIISMMTGLMISSFWFSYILLITMLSGALVLFIYMASVASNEKFNPSTKMMLIIIIMLLMMCTSMWYTDQEAYYTESKTLMENNQILSLMKMFNLHNMTITIMMISYLFMTMIVISYIVDVFEGPLRTKS